MNRSRESQLGHRGRSESTNTLFSAPGAFVHIKFRRAKPNTSSGAGVRFRNTLCKFPMTRIHLSQSSGQNSSPYRGLPSSSRKPSSVPFTRPEGLLNKLQALGAFPKVGRLSSRADLTCFIRRIFSFVKILRIIAHLVVKEPARSNFIVAFTDMRWSVDTGFALSVFIPFASVHFCPHQYPNLATSFKSHSSFSILSL